MRTRRTTSSAAIGAAVLSLALVGFTPVHAAEEDLPGWAFQEEVDLSDPSRWTTETGQAANTSSYDIPENVSFGDDGLTVRGTRESRSSADYTSGDAKGLDIEIPNYARVEAVGSVPYGPGLWPALMWLRPLDSPHGEIDLMEVFGADPRVAATLHNEYGPAHRSLQGSSKWNLLPNSDPTGRHTYVMEKTPDRIVISVDGTVILDAGPDDVRPGFDWDATFERPEATWYPRVTLQIGCPVVEPDCGIGLPAAGWGGGEVKLESLRIWKMDAGANPAPVPAPAPTPAPTPTPPPAPLPPVEEPPAEQPPAPQPPVEQPPVEEPPVEEPPVQEVPIENGEFALAPGRELRHDYLEGSADGSEATVAFTVPEDLGSGVMYQSIQVLSSDDRRHGYRATVTLKSSGSIRLTLARIVDNRSQVVQDQIVAPRGSYSAGDSVQVAIRVADGDVMAKAWPADGTEPGWQMTQGAGEVRTGDGVFLLGYLSRRAPEPVVAPFEGLTAELDEPTTSAP